MDSHHAHGLHSPYWWLRCLVGPTNDAHPAVATYHRLLVWDIVKGPRTTRVADRVLSPLIGKSLVVYLRKPEAHRAGDGAPGTGARRPPSRAGGDAAGGMSGATTEQTCGRRARGRRHPHAPPRCWPPPTPSPRSSGPTA